MSDRSQRWSSRNVLLSASNMNIRLFDWMTYFRRLFFASQKFDRWSNKLRIFRIISTQRLSANWQTALDGNKHLMHFMSFVSFEESLKNMNSWFNIFIFSCADWQLSIRHSYSSRWRMINAESREIGRFLEMHEMIDFWTYNNKPSRTKRSRINPYSFNHKPVQRICGTLKYNA